MTTSVTFNRPGGLKDSALPDGATCSEDARLLLPESYFYPDISPSPYDVYIFKMDVDRLWHGNTSKRKSLSKTPKVPVAPISPRFTPYPTSTRIITQKQQQNCGRVLPWLLDWKMGSSKGSRLEKRQFDSGSSKNSKKQTVKRKSKKNLESPSTAPRETRPSLQPEPDKLIDSLASSISSEEELAAATDNLSVLCDAARDLENETLLDTTTTHAVETKDHDGAITEWFHASFRFAASAQECLQDPQTYFFDFQKFTSLYADWCSATGHDVKPWFNFEWSLFFLRCPIPADSIRPVLMWVSRARSETRKYWVCGICLRDGLPPDVSGETS